MLREICDRDVAPNETSIIHRQRTTDCETFRIPPFMSKRTIRIRDEGWWSGVGGTYVCGTATM